MANFNPSKKTANDFNNNTQYLDYDPTKNQMGDGVQAATINNLVESQLWTQALATNTPDTSEANVVGTPSVEIVSADDGTPKLKFKNLKGAVGRNGATGAKGDDGRGISQIVEYYAVSASNTVEPTSWSTAVPTMTTTNKYLWNYSMTYYTDNTNTTSNMRVIGVYGEVDTSKYATKEYVDDEVGDLGNSIDTALSYYAKKDDTTQTIKAGTFMADGVMETPQIVADEYCLGYSGTKLVLNFTDGESTTQTVSQNAIKNALNTKASLSDTNAFEEYNQFEQSVRIRGSLFLGTSGENGDTTNELFFEGNTDEDYVILQVDTADVHDIYRLTLPAKDGTLATTADISSAIGDINSLLDTINGEVI